MIFNKFEGSQVIDLETGIIVDDSLLKCYGGGDGKGGARNSTPPQQPIVQPTPPVEEASVELDEEDKEKKIKTGKETLKVPLETSSSTGLNIGSSSDGLGI